MGGVTIHAHVKSGGCLRRHLPTGDCRGTAKEWLVTQRGHDDEGVDGGWEGGGGGWPTLCFTQAAGRRLNRHARRTRTRDPHARTAHSPGTNVTPAAKGGRAVGRAAQVGRRIGWRSSFMRVPTAAAALGRRGIGLLGVSVLKHPACTPHLDSTYPKNVHQAEPAAVCSDQATSCLLSGRKAEGEGWSPAHLYDPRPHHLNLSTPPSRGAPSQPPIPSCANCGMLHNEM
eukprot:366558-Chlamydomonas_euryale.AAC.7